MLLRLRISNPFTTQLDAMLDEWLMQPKVSNTSSLHDKKTTKSEIIQLLYNSNQSNVGSNKSVTMVTTTTVTESFVDTLS